MATILSPQYLLSQDIRDHFFNPYPVIDWRIDYTWASWCFKSPTNFELHFYNISVHRINGLDLNEKFVIA